MKKLLIVPAIAVLAATGAGFASSLAITDAPPIQVGETTDLRCADSVEVTAWGYNDIDGSVAYATLALDDDTAAGDDQCAGERIYVSPLDASGNLLGPGYNTGSIVVPAGDDAFQVMFANPVSANNLEGVRIGIDQGF